MACTSSFDDDSISSESLESLESSSAQLDVNLRMAQVSLAGVTQIALTEQQRMTFVAGRLGVDTSTVLAAFTPVGTATEVSERVGTLGFTTTRFHQTLDGLDVVGGDIRIIRNPQGEVIAASGVSVRSSDIATATVAVADARSQAMASSAGADQADAGVLVYVAGSNLAPTLAWQFVVQGLSANGDWPRDDLVFVDALEGDVVARHPRVYTARNRETFAANNDTQAMLVRSEGEGPSGNAQVDIAHNAAGDTYDCMNELFERDSYDDLGAKLLSVVNFNPNELVGGVRRPFNNAAWFSEAKVMGYGPGFAEADVGGHELAHAVTNFTADLIYMDESGALNEGTSDIMMAICDIHKAGAIDEGTWQVGEDLVTDVLVGPIRWMDDPTRDGYSTDHYSNLFLDPQDLDNGGVHSNSGIYNLYFVLLTEGGVHPKRTGEQQVQGIGAPAASQIFYRALSMYMNQSTNFAAARVASEQAAKDLYGAGSFEFTSVQEAWYAVGVGGAPDPACGNKRVDSSETCDDGNTTDGDGCSAACVAEVCGDGIINNNNEVCDDGNAEDGDGCSATCEIEPEESGCGCQADPSAPVGAGWLLLGALSALGFIRRRRSFAG